MVTSSGEGAYGNHPPTSSLLPTNTDAGNEEVRRLRRCTLSPRTLRPASGGIRSLGGIERIRDVSLLGISRPEHLFLSSLDRKPSSVADIPTGTCVDGRKTAGKTLLLPIREFRPHGNGTSWTLHHKPRINQSEAALGRLALVSECVWNVFTLWTHQLRAHSHVRLLFT